MSDLTALDKHPCAACGAQAEWNPSSQLLVCPFCGTAAPFQVDRRRDDRGARSREGAARPAGRRARLADREAHRPVPELQGGLGVRPRAGRTELRLLRIAGARGLRGDQGADPPAEPAAVQGHGRAGPRADPAVVREQMARARTASSARRSSIACTASTFPTGRSTRRSSARGRPKPGTTTTRRRPIGITRAEADAAGPPRALGAGVGRGPAFLRRRAGAGDARRVARRC